MNDAAYDHIAVQYKNSKQLGFRKYIEEYTLLKLIGDPTGKHLLDLACGEGIYTRKLKSLGAERILGVDISAEMIRLAREEEAQHPLGCEYLLHDVLTLDLHEQFDLVTGMYLLNYARTKDELLQMCRVVYSSLKDNGLFIGFNDNPNNQLKNYGSYAKYGFVKESTEKRAEGDLVRYVIRNSDDVVFSIDNFYFSPQTYQECFMAAGFTHFQWEGPYLDSEMLGNPYWDKFLADPPLTGFFAHK